MLSKQSIVYICKRCRRLWSALAQHPSTLGRTGEVVGEIDHSEFDVVVVGFGVAGACAAIAAAENGARVLVIDRSWGGGASALSGGVVYAGAGTTHQRAAGYDDTPDNMFNYLLNEVNGAVKDETLQRFCEESPLRLAWLEQHGARFASTVCDYKTSYPTDRHYLYFSGNERAYPYCEHATPAPRGHRQVARSMSSGRALWTALSQAALRLGVTFWPLTRAEEIIMSDGQVAALRCQRVANVERSVLASLNRRTAPVRAKFTNWTPALGRRLPTGQRQLWRHSRDGTVQTSNVVLAAGGYAFNRDMVRRYAPDYAGTSPLGTEGDDGSAIQMGVTAGATTGHLDRMTAWRFLSPPPALLEGVTVGANGVRIANEDLYGATHAEIMVREFDGRGYLIFDSGVWKRALAQLLSHTQPFHRVQLAAVICTELLKAPTLRELATKLGICPSGLETTVRSYNNAIVSGARDPAYKSTDMCVALNSPPYYGLDISIRPSAAYFVPGMSLGGLRVDEANGRVLTHDDNPMGGLYAAGRTAVGICSNSYISGLALADCVFSGKRAGEHAAAQVMAPQ